MTRIYEQIIGCNYPVKDENNKVIGSKKITSATMLENVAGLVIGLDNRPAQILISLNEARELTEKKEENNG